MKDREMVVKSPKLQQNQRGAVSIFIVVFSALLIMVITVSFVRIMIRDQHQASMTDLSQSAYDSAQAGVEDAKRALIRWHNACVSGSDAEDCVKLKSIIEDENCNTVPRMLYDQPADHMEETKIKQTSSTDDELLDQAYTCTIIKTETDNYQGRLEADQSTLISLKGVSQFNKIRLSWFTEQDLSSGNVASLDNDPDTSLPNTWDPNRPSLMRTQLIQAESGFNLDHFDTNEGSSTLYFYPKRVGVTTSSFASDGRLAQKNIETTRCTTALGSDLYFCSMTIDLQNPISSGDSALLRLSSYYNAASFEVRLLQDDVVVKFDGVQPEVDSTGRANDLFRRVVSRIEMMDSTFPYPDAAINVSGNLCKTFLVTDSPDEYQSGSCAP